MITALGSYVHRVIESCIIRLGRVTLVRCVAVLMNTWPEQCETSDGEAIVYPWAYSFLFEDALGHGEYMCWSIDTSESFHAYHASHQVWPLPSV